MSAVSIIAYQKKCQKDLSVLRSFRIEKIPTAPVVWLRLTTLHVQGSLTASSFPW